jgi:hypothetical protein
MRTTKNQGPAGLTTEEACAAYGTTASPTSRAPLHPAKWQRRAVIAELARDLAGNYRSPDARWPRLERFVDLGNMTAPGGSR